MDFPFLNLLSMGVLDEEDAEDFEIFLFDENELRSSEKENILDEMNSKIRW